MGVIEMGHMGKVLVIDPGYSLGKAVDEWKEGSFPGSVLYGVHHFSENGYIPIFETMDTTVKETSKGDKNILFSRIRTELSHLREIKKHSKGADVIYIPLVNFGLSVILLKKMMLIQKPVVGIVHSLNCDGIRRVEYREIFEMLSHIVFLSQKVKDEADRLFHGKYSEKSSCIQLMPEDRAIDRKREFDGRYRYDVCMIGKTGRDYSTFYSAIKQLKCRAFLRGGIEAEGYKDDFVDNCRGFLGYAECKDVYSNSKINCIITNENNGIQGLTSISDSLEHEIPMVVTRMKYLGINVEDERLGIEVAPYSSDELADAITRLSQDRDFYNEIVENMRRRKRICNTEVFAAKLCDIFDLILKREK